MGNPLPSTMTEQSFALNEEENLFLVVKGNMAWIRHKPAPKASTGYRDGPRHIFDIDIMPDVEIALLSETEAQIRYKDGREKKIIISGQTIVFEQR